MITIYVDAYVNPSGAGYGIFCEETKDVIKKSIMQEKTINELEYAAVMEALNYIKKQNSQHTCIIFTDSMLVVNQINGKWKLKNPRMRGLALECREKIAGFLQVEVKHVRRELNLMGLIFEKDQEKNREKLEKIGRQKLDELGQL